MLKHVRLMCLTAATASLALLAGCHSAPQYSAPYNVSYKQHNAQLQALHNHGVGIVELGQTLKLVLPNASFFKGPTASLITWRKYTLYRVADLVRTYPDTPVYVSGYSDNAYNKKNQYYYSLFTARGVAAFLWNHGLSMERVQIRPLSTYYKVSSNSRPKGASDNRRVEIYIGLSEQLTKPYDNYKTK